MGLKADFQNLSVDLITNVFADIALPVTVKINTAVYDEEYGDVLIETHEETYTAIVGPWVSDRTETEDIQAGDLRVVMPYLGVVLAPKPQEDSMVIKGDTYDIINVSLDAAESTYILQGRLRSVPNPFNF